MKLRKTGICKECGEILYGNDYGASGHKCIPSATLAPDQEKELQKDNEKRRTFEVHDTMRRIVYNLWVENKCDAHDTIFAISRLTSHGSGYSADIFYAYKPVDRNKSR